MSRYCDYSAEEAFPNQAELWWSSAQRALKGRRGRKVLADLREALLALPEKRLISRALCTVDAERRMPEPYTTYGPDLTVSNEVYLQHFQQLIDEQGEGVCAVGAYLWWRRVKAGVDPAEAFRQLPTLEDLDEPDALDVTANLAQQEAGVAYSLAWQLAFRNDEEYRGLTPEQRYQALLRWLDTELGIEPIAPTPVTTDCDGQERT